MKHIKLYEQFDESDPYDEEDWGYDDLPPILQIAKIQNKPYDQITELDCFYRKLTDLEGIENLINLEHLFCEITNLTSLKGIENLTNLKELWCHDNNLTNLDGLENLINLKFLYCQYNRLTSLKGIENLTNLELLYCNGNSFSNEYKEYLRNYCQKENIELTI